MQRPETSSAAGRFLLAWGVALVVLGTVGFVVNPDFGTGNDVSEDHLVFILHTNGWHNAAAFAGAALSLAWWAWGRALSLGATVSALATGVVPGLQFLAVGHGNVAFDRIPVDIVDVIVLHLVPGVVGLACAWTTAWSRSAPSRHLGAT